MFRSYLNTRQMATVVVRKHLSTRARSEMGNHNNWVSSNANSPEMNANFQAMMNANFQAMMNAYNKEINADRKEMNANFQAMINSYNKEMNADRKEMNANFQAMMNADRKEMSANFQAMMNAKPSSRISFEALIGIAGVTSAVVFGMVGLNQRIFDKITEENAPMKTDITQVKTDIIEIKKTNGLILNAINNPQPQKR